MDQPVDHLTYSPQDRALLERHVSSTDSNVYSIFNLPEEVIAVVFAYVSRSPLSFRDNLLKLIKDKDIDIEDVPTSGSPGSDFSAAQEKARKFHERWVVNYGHASVAEHAVAHIGVERISRLASAQLELSNPFLSFTEYSQRYQQPQEGDYHVPICLTEPGQERLLHAYHTLQKQTYRIYRELFDGLCSYHEQRTPRRDDERKSSYNMRIRRQAFEDARYALTLGVWTNLGMTGNGRAIRDSLVQLYSDPYGETTRLAEAIRVETTKTLPTLIRYAQPSEHIEHMRRTLSAWSGRTGDSKVPGRYQQGDNAGPGVADLAHDFIEALATRSEHSKTVGTVRLVRWPAMELDVAAGLVSTNISPVFATRSEKQLHRELAARLLMKHSALTYSQALERVKHTPDEELAQVVTALTERLGPYDLAPDVFRSVVYSAEFCISEANWHQLLRHSRKTDFVYQRPTVTAGYTVPPPVEEAGLAPVLERAVELSATLYRRLKRSCPEAADYVVTNAHRKSITATFSLWELYHLVNLRMASAAQWDIRYTIEELYNQVVKIHPRLLTRAHTR